MNVSETVSGSFRDPSGRVFRRNGVLLRRVNTCYRRQYDALMSSGLYAALVGEKLLIPHEEKQVPPIDDDCYKVIAPALIPFISYPYEWCFSQLRDAALCTLRIQKISLDRGQSLKDSSAYNIQFLDGKAIHIDTLSFEPYREGSPWVAYRQFCQHFLAPLALMSLTDVRCSQLLRSFLDGIPLDMAARLLPGKTRFSLPIQLHIHLHARMQSRYKGASAQLQGKGIGLTQMRALLDSLESLVTKLRAPTPKSGWSGYYSMQSYSEEGLSDKQAILERFCDAAGARAIWDLGANTGLFSRIAAAKASTVLSIDSDHDAVELNYRQCREHGRKNILPLWMDLTNPSGGIGWDNNERLPLKDRGRPELVIALALVHHLAISNNVPLGMIAAYLKSITMKWLIVEFVPKSDPKTQLLLSSREDIFSSYTKDGFERDFASFFELVEAGNPADSERTIYLMKTRENAG